MSAGWLRMWVMRQPGQRVLALLTGSAAVVCLVAWQWRGVKDVSPKRAGCSDGSVGSKTVQVKDNCNMPAGAPEKPHAFRGEDALSATPEQAAVPQTPPVSLDRPEAFTTPPTSRRPARRAAPPLEVDDDFAVFHSNFHCPGSARKARAHFSDADDDMAAFAAAFHSPGSKARMPEYAGGVSPLVRSMSQDELAMFVENFKNSPRSAPSERKKLKVVELAAFAAVRSTLHARHTERDLVADPATGGGHDET